MRMMSSTKKKSKKLHDRKCQRREFVEGQKFILFNLRLKLFLEKLKSRWSRQYKILKTYPHGAVDLLNEQKLNGFKVNGKRVKAYLGVSLNNTRTTIGLAE